MIAVRPSFQETAKIARMAIPFMSEKKISITPKNYMVWYTYFGDNQSDLNKALDMIIDQNSFIGEDIMEEIYRRFFIRNFTEDNQQKFAAEINAVTKVQERASGIINPLAENLKNLSNRNETYSHHLDSYVTNLSPKADVEMIESIVHSLTEETKNIAAENRAIGSDLEEYSGQLDQLRQNLETARLEARMDDLTQIRNRRAFNENIEQERESSIQNNSISSFALIDIDLFKRINDNFGHPVGDKALRAIAKLVKNCIGSEHSLYRYGGEEFGIIFSNMRIAATLEILEKVREAVEKNNFVVRGSTITITISIGVAEIDSERTVLDTIKLADEALYRAKSEGRNCVRIEKHAARKLAKKT